MTRLPKPLAAAALASAVCVAAFPALAEDAPQLPEVPADVQKDQRELPSAIPRAITLLEAGEHRVFIAAFAHPAELTRMLTQWSIDELAASLAAGKADELTLALQQAVGKEPHLNEANDRADFEVTIGDRRRTLTLVKVAGRWRIEN